MLTSLHLGLANGLPDAVVVGTLLDILYRVVLVSTLFSTSFIVKFDGVDGLKGSKEIVCYRPTCTSLCGTKWQNINRILAQGDLERMNHVTDKNPSPQG